MKMRNRDLKIAGIKKKWSRKQTRSAHVYATVIGEFKSGGYSSAQEQDIAVV